MKSFFNKAARTAITFSLCTLLVACGGGSSETTPTTSNVANSPSPIIPPVNTSIPPVNTSIPPVNTSTLVQYTPNQADWSTFASKQAAAGIAKHDPDSVPWITKATWEAAKWDSTIYNPTTMTKADFTAAICPTGDTIRGIREVFYATKPFADDANPTKAEVDEWHRVAINHVRALIGYTNADQLVQKDHCMSARALWGDERKFTRMWDRKYPTGTCLNSTNPHCGASFLPDAADQKPYLPAGHATCKATQGTEGIFTSKSYIPWSIKWSRSFCSTISREGFWGGHTGPWFHREKFGLSFWDANVNDNGSNANLRAKWTGTLKKNNFCNPNIQRC